MDIQAFLELSSKMRKQQNTNLTIGQALEQLSKMPPTAKIKVDNSGMEEHKNYLIDLYKNPNYAEENKDEFYDMYLCDDWSSYRGYYEDMRIGVTNELCEFTVQQLIDLLNSAKAKGKMYGYKGGEFSVDDSTILWLEKLYNYCSGIAPIQFYKIDDENILLITKHIA